MAQAGFCYLAGSGAYLRIGKRYCNETTSTDNTNFCTSIWHQKSLISDPKQTVFYY